MNSYDFDTLINRANKIKANPAILLNQFLEISLENINDIKPGTYKLKHIPTIEQIKAFPLYKGGNSEIGLICYQGVWIVHFADVGERQVQFPIDIRTLAYLGDLDFFLHSHPPLHGDIHYWLPSIEDLDFSKSTHNLTQFISTDRGLVKLKVANRDVSYADMFRRYILDKTNGNYDSFRALYNSLMQEFCNLYQSYKIIDWRGLNPKDTILTLIEASKENTIKDGEDR